MPDQEDDRIDLRQSDHDLLVRLVERDHQHSKEIRDLRADNKMLMDSRSKLIGWCGGVSAAAAIIVKLFWPGHG